MAVPNNPNMAFLQQPGAAYPWILDHILTYPGNYEIPLRTMYTLNSSLRTAPLLHQPRRIALNNGFNKFTPGSSDDQENPVDAATEQFKASLMAQISQLPCQPASLPPSFVTNFVRRCFPPQLEMVDFNHALTALDYLRDLEQRRGKEHEAALHRLGIDKNNYGPQEKAVMQSTYPGVATWVASMDDKEKKVLALYTQIYIGLRRWVLLNEMMQEDFTKANCIAMLNTLYPILLPCQPTPQLTQRVLLDQRDWFFRYIQAVEKNGLSVLTKVIQQGARQERGETNGWPSLREVVDKYLRVANSIIEECSEITNAEYFGRRKVDSAISMATNPRPSTSSGGSFKDKPLPDAPAPTPKKGITLVKITKELKKMRSKKSLKESSDAEETGTGKSLKKMKSTGALGDLREQNLGVGSSTRRASDDANAAYDVDKMLNQKMLIEARLKNNNGYGVSSGEHGK